MRRTSELVDAVKGALSGATMDAAAELALAQEVVRACADARERLVRAIDLMRQGLRGEAMVIVDVRPALTETAAALSVDAVRKHWRKRCMERGLPVPQAIDPDLVHELSEGVAEAEDPRVDQLMRRLRYQNLAHAPAHERLRTMWALRRFDPATVRDDDVRAFEQAALKELMDRLRQAVEGDDAAAACVVRDELNRADWSDRDIAVRRATAETECSALQARHASRRGAAELDSLETCVMRGDVELARAALDRYEATVREVHALGGAVPPDVQSRARPLAQWVADRERADAQQVQDRDRVDRLEALALSASSTVPELERALLECDRAGLAVSEAVRASVERRIVAERRRSSRVKAAIVASAVLAVIAIAAGSAWWAVQLQREADVAKLVASADAALGRGDIEAAARMLDDASDTSAWMRDDESVAAARQRVDAARADREAKDRAFEAALAAAGDPRADGAQARFGEAALKAARTPEQRERSERWLTSHAAERTRRQRAVDEAFMTQVNGLLERLAVIEGKAEGQEEELSRIATEAERLARGSTAGPDAQLAMQRLKDRIGIQRDMLARERTMRAASEAELQAITQLVARVPDSFAAALAEFIRDLPDSSRTPDFQNAAVRQEAWKEVMALPELAARVSRSLDAGNAAERARAAEALDRAMVPGADSPWFPGLQAAAELCLPQDQWMQLLDDYITLYKVTRLRMVELKDGTRHYYDESAKGPATGAGGKRVYSVMVSSDGKVQSVALDESEIAYDGPSPQSAVFEQIRPMIRGARASGNVSTLLSVIDRIRSRTDMDPVLQATFLERIMSEASEGAPHLAAPMDEAITSIQKLQLGTVEWIAPGNPKSRPEAREAADVVKRLVDVALWQRLHERRLAEVRKWMTESRVQPVGMLDKAGEGPATALISPKSARKPPYQLYAVADAPDGSLRIRDMGAVAADGSVTLDRAAALLPAGTLLFGGKVESMPGPSGP